MFQENSKNEEVHLYFVTTNKAAWLIDIIHYYKKKNNAKMKIKQ